MTVSLSHVKSQLEAAGLRRPLVDTHIHCWGPNDLPAVVAPAIGGRPDLAQNFGVSYFNPIVRALDGHGYIVVQARDPADNGLAEAERLNAQSGDGSYFLGVVAGVDLSVGDEVESYLKKLRGLNNVRGVRMIAPENLGVGIYGSREAIASASKIGDAGLVLELLLRSKNPGQMNEVTRFVKTVMNAHHQPFILNHLGKPLGLTEGTPQQDWIEFMKDLGATNRVYVKLSALRGEMGPNADRSKMFPFFDVALEAFGPSRMLFGSDHPVSHDYGECVLDVAEWILSRGLQGTDIANRVFSRNAVGVYQLHC